MEAAHQNTQLMKEKAEGTISKVSNNKNQQAIPTNRSSGKEKNHATTVLSMGMHF